MNFEFATAVRIVFGRGALKDAGALAKALGKRPLVVTGKTPVRAAALLDSLRASHLEPILYSFEGEPCTETVEQGTTLAANSAADCVIGFGGGSVIDAGKAIAAMLTNPGDLFDYLEVVGRGKSLENPSAPYIAIPTTAGTGSEVTRNAVLSASGKHVKVSLRSPMMLPRVALVDPELTLGLPRPLTASTGLDALTQLIEPYVCSRPNPIVDALCLEGVKRVSRALRAAYCEGSNTEAREDMAVASLFSGLALANAGLGAVHGFAGPIGGMFPAPHGAVCAALLPHVISANLRALRQRQPHSPSLQRYEQLARLLTGVPDAVAEELADWIAKLLQDLDISGLAAFGMKPTDADALSDKAAKASSMKANPIMLTHQELAAIFLSAL